MDMIARILLNPLIIIILLVCLVLFVLQNQQSIPLVFFGTKTTSLPVGLWVLSFAGAGLLTSLFIQLLSQPGQKTPTSRQEFNPPPTSRRTMREDFQEQEEQPPSYKQIPQTPLYNVSENTQDWENEQDSEEWDIETPPAQPNPTPEYIEEKIEEIDQKISAVDAPHVEMQQTPKSTTRQGSVYSYTYREGRKKRDRSPKEVYDADYRVITPPYRDNTPQQTDRDDDEEDWV